MIYLSTKFENSLFNLKTVAYKQEQRTIHDNVGSFGFSSNEPKNEEYLEALEFVLVSF